MKIGPTREISDAFFPDIEISAVDRKGRALHVGDKVRIYGCEAEHGYIGYNGRAILYFEADGKSVNWRVDDNVEKSIELFAESEK